MLRIGVPLLVIAIAVLVAVPVVSAHVPNFPEDNDSLETALFIDDPSKSIVVYSSLHHHEEGQYYSMHLGDGDRIYLGLLIPMNSDENFTPSFVLMGPGLGEVGELPPYIERPGGSGYIVVEGERAEDGEYEGFSPSAFYELGELDVLSPSDGIYYVSVFSGEGEGNYGLVVGYVESFTVIEFIRVPLDLIVVYQWEGQTLFEILLPFVITVGLGLILLLYGMRRRGLEVPAYGFVGAVAGLFFLGSSAVMLYQMFYVLLQVPANSQVMITLIFMLIPLILGLAIIRVGLLAARRPRLRVRAIMIILAIIALFLWAGYYVGPALAIIAALLPASIASKLVRI
jgi:hypothetical protein